MPNPGPFTPYTAISNSRGFLLMALITFLAVCAALPAAFLVAGGGM
jgi:hypothetical protein